MGKSTLKGKGIYYALIGTFILLWLVVAFVSTLHAITFFQLTNAIALSVLLGLAFEVGQATVLFSILMTENKNKLLAWTMMIFLTALQVTANVYASFRFMDLSNSNEWTYWQRSILFSVQAESTEMYKVIISWISGALLPLIALGMTSLVAENIKIMKEKKSESLNDNQVKTETDEQVPDKIPAELLVSEISRARLSDEDLKYIESLISQISEKKNKSEDGGVKTKEVAEDGDRVQPESIVDNNPPQIVNEIVENVIENKPEVVTPEVTDPITTVADEPVSHPEVTTPSVIPPEKLDRIREMAIKKAVAPVGVEEGSTSIDSNVIDDIYVEDDDINPPHITYTNVGDEMVAKVVDEDVDDDLATFSPKKTFLRYVRNSKRKKS